MNNEIAFYLLINLMCLSIIITLSFHVRDSIIINSKNYLKIFLSVFLIMYLIEFVYKFSYYNVLTFNENISYILVNTYYFLLPGLLYHYICLCNSLNEEYNKFNNKFFRKFIIIYPIVLLIFLLLNTKYNFLFSLNNNIVIKEKYFIFMIYFTFLPLFIYSLTNLINIFTSKYNKDKKIYLSLFMFSIIVYILELISFSIDNNSIFTIGLCITILNLFIIFQNKIITTDSLTKINNRFYLEKIIKNSFKIDYYLFVIDINKFKLINDNYGHIEGDNALFNVASILNENSNKNGSLLFRVGGDEFVILGKFSSLKEVKKFIKNIYTDFENFNINANMKYNLSVSIGYSKYNSKIKTANQWISKADSKMYQDKEKSR